MFNICMRILNHLGEAEDALQEAFVDAFTNLHQFRQQSTFGAWLKQIVVNKAINHMRSRKVKWVEIEEWKETMEESDHIEDTFGLSESDTMLEIERVKSMVQKLPDGYRVVLSLYLFEGYDHEEIGEVLGISETTSRTQYMRAKRKLTDMLVR
jgi:RNA polymerase sigma factor (sigma-70 family)